MKPKQRLLRQHAPSAVNQAGLPDIKNKNRSIAPPLKNRHKQPDGKHLLLRNTISQ